MDKTKWLAEMAKKGGSAKALLMEAMIKDRPQIITDGTLAEEMASKSEGGPRKPKHYQADSGKSFSDRISGRRQSSNIEIRPIRTQGMWDDMMTDAIMEDMMKAKKD
jgi:hypothetical protein